MIAITTIHVALSIVAYGIDKFSVCQILNLSDLISKTHPPATMYRPKLKIGQYKRKKK